MKNKQEKLTSLLRELCLNWILLGDREQTVLSERIGDGGTAPKTLETIGDDFAVTRERIRQIEAKAIMRLRHPRCDRNLMPPLAETKLAVRELLKVWHPEDKPEHTSVSSDEMCNRETLKQTDFIHTCCDFGQRADTCFYQAEILTVGDLLGQSENDLLNLKSFGRKTLHVVKTELAKFGLALRTEANAE